MTNKTNRNFRAFSLGEVLLAGFVLTVGLLSISALMAKSLKNSFEIRDSIIAVELSQEGVELVRNVRDNNLAQGGSGFAAFDSANTNRHCRIDYSDSFSYPDKDTVNPKLDCDVSQGAASRYTLDYTNAGFYQHQNSQNPNTRFSRYIYINANLSGNAKTALVRSFVYWGGGIPDPNDTGQCSVAKKCVFTEVNLTNWK